MGAIHYMDVSKYLSQHKLVSKSSSPLYMQISELISICINNHTLPSRTKLPPERELAAIFAVSRTTAINAYRHLEDMGLVKTRVGSGTYVAQIPPSYREPSPGVPWTQLFKPYPQTPLYTITRDLVSFSASEDSISLAAGTPDPAFYPLSTFQSLFNKHIAHTDPACFGHIAVEGYPPLRQAIASWLRQQGINAALENTCIISGSQQGLHLLGSILLERGDYVIIQSPTYLGAIQIFQSLGARILTLPAIHPFPLDILEDYLTRYRPKMLYVLPTYQNPSGQVMAEEERQNLLRLTAKHRLVIVEDDPYSQLYYGEEPPPSLKALDFYDGVVYIGTFSKILFPGLRMGYMVAHPTLLNRLVMEKQYVDLHSSSITQWLLHKFLAEDYLITHLTQVRKEYKSRRDALSRALKSLLGQHLLFTLPEGGFYFWCRLVPEITASDLLYEAKKKGIYFVPGKAFYTISDTDREFRLCFATHSEKNLAVGINRLAEAMDQLLHSNKWTLPPYPSSKPII